MGKGKTILYISSGSSTFVRRDIEFLSKYYPVHTFLNSWRPKVIIPVLMIRQLIEMIINMPSSRVIVVMFGGYWSFIPAFLGKLFRKPVYIILGGTDCVSFPSYHYGSLRKPLLRTFIKWSYQMCGHLLPVDHSLVLSEYTYEMKATYPRQGFRFFFPKISTPYTVIYNGFDSVFWKPDIDSTKRMNSFITVASISDETRFFIKGIDLVCFLASSYPDLHFTIIGITQNMQKLLVPDVRNLHCFEFLSSQELRSQLSEHEFYLQLSISEGFPNALCEAMLCECIPVGSSVGAIPFIINDPERIVPKRDIRILQDRIESLFAIPAEQRALIARRSRQRIEKDFSIAQREHGFIRLIEGDIM